MKVAGSCNSTLAVEDAKKNVFSLTPFFTPSDDDVANSPLWGISETAV
jgi:hypothetical protein